MYKHQIKSLVLATVIGLGAGFQVQAGERDRSTRVAEYAQAFCLVTIGILGVQWIWQGMVSKEAKLLDNFNTTLETTNNDYYVIRDQNRIRTMQTFGAGYTDEELRKLGFSNDTRKLVAVNRDKKRADGCYIDLDATKVRIKEEKQGKIEKLEREKMAQRAASWWWPFGKKK